MISETISFPFLRFLLSVTIKTSIVYLTASVLVFALRKHTSIVKRTLWVLVILSFVLLFIQPFLPSIWEISVESFLIEQDKPEISAAIPNESGVQIESINNPDENFRYPALYFVFDSLRSWSGVILYLWAGGLFIFGAYFLNRRRYIRKIKREALHADQKVVAILESSVEKIGIRRKITLKISDRLKTACTLGIKNPAVFLPAESKTWSASSIRMILYHELTHIKSKDNLLELMTQGLCAVFWFHPVIWMTARRYRSEREKACDETVIQNGIRPSEYASQLLKIASSIKNGRVFVPGNAVLLSKNGIRSRLLAVLNPKRINKSQRINRFVFCSLVILFISLSFISLQFGMHGETLGKDALAYWAAVPHHKTSAAFLLEKDISSRGFYPALRAVQQKRSSGLNQYYFDRKEIDAVGRRLLEAEKTSEALEIFQFNRQLFPNTWQVYNSLGNVYQAKGDLEKAISSFEKMLGLDVPNESKIHRHIEELRQIVR